VACRGGYGEAGLMVHEDWFVNVKETQEIIFKISFISEFI
jgi:hypothetical protein